ncbi:MAG: prolipoprotein diacylglyceryl transferase [Chloroflexi bacterium]|nr:prolipoprotein diacylglyceryl transferase [Chloroflexota bacterium]
MTPPVVQVGPISIGAFALIILLALIVGALLAVVRLRQSDQPLLPILDLLLLGPILAIVLGRLFYIWNPPPSAADLFSRSWYLSNLLDLQAGPLAVWTGGLGSAGLLLGALSSLVLVMLLRVMDWRHWIDRIIPAFLLTCSIAALANLANRHLLGPPTTLPWGLTLANRPPAYADLLTFPPETLFHPTPGYVALWMLFSLVVVLLIERFWARPISPGRIGILDLGLAATGWLVFDFLRIDLNTGLLGLTGLQWLSVVLLVSLVLLDRLTAAHRPDHSTERVATDLREC